MCIIQKHIKTGNKVLTINYSLDNYVAVYYYDGNSYESRAGYLEAVPTTREDRKKFIEALDSEAKEYYAKEAEQHNEYLGLDDPTSGAWRFTEWFNEKISAINNGKPENEKINLNINENNLALPGETSSFNDEKYDVIKNSVVSNLVPAMHMYGFDMPELTDLDWDLILNNVCCTAFMQNMPVGTTTYNNYTIALSTENKEFVDENDIYFVNTDNSNNIVGSYHRIWCDNLANKDEHGNELKIIGYNKMDFKTKDDLKTVHACYKCMVRASNPTIGFAEKYSGTLTGANKTSYDLEKREAAYYSALAREKKNLYKVSEFINGSEALRK